MLSIIVEGSPLDLGDDFSITLNLKSPIFNELGDHSFPFKVPATDRNKAILGWKNRIQSSKSIYQIYSGSLRWNTSELYTVDVMIKEANDKFFDGTLLLNRGYFNYQMKDKLLSRLDMGSRSFASETEAMDYFNWTLSHLYPDCDFSMAPVSNSQFFDPPTENPELMSYNFQFSDGKLHRRTTDGKSQTILVPMLFLRYVLKRFCTITGYTLIDDFFTSTIELSNLVVYNSTNLNELLFGMFQMYYCLHLPSVKPTEFITGLEKWFNCSFHIDSKKRIIRIYGNKNLLKDARSEKFSGNILSISQEIPEQITGFNFSVSPDSGDKDYQAQVDSEKWILDYLQGSVATFNDIPPYPYTNLGDVYYVADTDKWWQLGVNPISFLYEWQLLPNGPSLVDRLMYRWAGDKNKYETCFSSLLSYYTTVKCGNLGSERKKITPRLFWIDQVGWLGPKKLQSFSVSDNFSLQYPGTHGMFNTFWKEWVDWIMTRRKYVKIIKHLDFCQLQEIDFSRKYEIFGSHYFISEVNVTLRQDQIKPALLKCYLV